MDDSQSNSDQDDINQGQFYLNESPIYQIALAIIHDRVHSPQQSQNSLFNQDQNNHQQFQQETINVDPQQFNQQVEQLSVEQINVYDQDTTDSDISQGQRNQLEQLSVQLVPEARQHGHDNTGPRTGRNDELTIVLIYIMVVGNNPFLNLNQKICTWLKFATQKLGLKQNFPGLQTFYWLSIRNFAKFIQNSGFLEEVFQIDLFNLEWIKEFFSKKLGYAKYLNRYSRNSLRYRFIKFVVMSCNKIIFKCVKRKIRDICLNRRVVNKFRDLKSYRQFRQLQEVCKRHYPQSWRHFCRRLRRLERIRVRNIQHE